MLPWTIKCHPLSQNVVNQIQTIDKSGLQSIQTFYAASELLHKRGQVVLNPALYILKSDVVIQRPWALRKEICGSRYPEYKFS